MAYPPNFAITGRNTLRGGVTWFWGVSSCLPCTTIVLDMTMIMIRMICMKRFIVVLLF